MNMSDDKEQLKNINLWIETIEKLKIHNLTWDDVKKVIVIEDFINIDRIDSDDYREYLDMLTGSFGGA